MEVTIPFDVVFEINNRPDAGEISTSIISNKELLTETAAFLCELFPDLEIDSIRISVISISQNSPLREAFAVAIIGLYQGHLGEDVPKIIQDIIGMHVPPEYNSIIGVATAAIIFFGVDLVLRTILEAPARTLANKKYAALRSILAEKLQVDEDAIDRALARLYKAKRGNNLIRSAVRFFRLSKNEPGTGVTIARDIYVEPELISEVPHSDFIHPIQPEEIQIPMQNVTIVLVAQDLDKSKQGWAGIIEGVSDERMRMQVYPTIDTHDIYLKPSIRGDVLVSSRLQPDGSYKPHSFHLVRIIG